MAVMIPDIPHQFAPSSLEGVMFDALSKLPNEYYVFHSFRITTISDGFFRESETDFVVFNPKYGVICLEAKAGQIRYENGYWYYANGERMHNGGPFNQASSNKYKLIHYIEKSHSAQLLARCKFLHAVWFPSISDAVVNSMTLPPEADKKLVLTKDALENIEFYIRRIYDLELPTHIVTNLTENDSQRLIREVFCPQFNVFPTATFENDLKKMVFHRLLKEQIGILNFLTEQKTAVINGAAGTGKTMIAVEKAQRHANSGERVLFLCYNSKLRDFLSENYASLNVDYFTIAGLACKLCETVTPDYGKLKSLLDDMFFTNKFPYRHVIVDEGQDFGADVLDEIELLDTIKTIVTDTDSVDGTFYVFYDRLQMIQSKRFPKYIEDADCRLTLYRNCRNTENIAITSLQVISERKPLLIDNCIKGKPAVIHYCDSPNSVITIIDKIIESFKKEGVKDIVILTCKTESDSVLYGFTKNNKYRDKYQFTTCRKFKGLEADAIILIDVDEKSFNAQNVMLYYVGISRARLRMDIVAQLNDDNCIQILSNVLNFKGKIKNPKRELATELNALGKIL